MQSAQVLVTPGRVRTLALITPHTYTRGKAIGFICRLLSPQNHHIIRRFRHQGGLQMWWNSWKQRKIVFFLLLNSRHLPWTLQIVRWWHATPIDHTHVLILPSLLVHAGHEFYRPLVRAAVPVWREPIIEIFLCATELLVKVMYMYVGSSLSLI